MENQLPGLKVDVPRVQFGGATGSNTAVAPHGPAIAASMAKTLNLTNSPPWHRRVGAIAATAGDCRMRLAALPRSGGRASGR